jgi:hypothetical protein
MFGILACSFGLQWWGYNLGKNEFNNLFARVVGSLMCGFLWGDGSDDKDVKFEYGEASTWACGAQTWVWPCGYVFFGEGLP